MRYLADRGAQRAADVQSILDALTVREQRLVMDAAVMGYVRGKMSGRDDPIPKNDAILREVIDACQSFPDLYAVLTGVRLCSECGHPEYAHRDAEEDDDDEAETPGVCLQCEHDGADDANHDYRRRG